MAARGTVTVGRDWRQFVERSDFDELAPLAQALFLVDAMDLLGMTRDDFAERISVSKRCLAKWMARQGTSEFRKMPNMAWRFIGEILEHETKVA